MSNCKAFHAIPSAYGAFGFQPATAPHIEDLTWAIGIRNLAKIGLSSVEALQNLWNARCGGYEIEAFVLLLEMQCHLM